eukprot:s736_g3.t1
MLVTPSSSPPATPSSPPRTAPGQALTHAGHEDDDHWHDCQEPFCPRTLNFNGLDQSAQFPRLTSEDLDSARRVSQTEPAITPPCSLPVTPNGSRAASPVGAGPSRLVRRWSRISGYRTPGTADGFVRCWQTRTDATSEASSSRMSRPSLAPPVDQTVQRDQALSETRGMLEQCILELIARAGNLEAQQQDVWRRLQSSLTRTERLLKHVEPDDLLGPLEQKAVVLTFVMEVHIQKKKYRRQTAAALKTLLQSEAWRQAFLQDLELRALSQKPEAQELRGLLPPIPPPTLTRLPIAAKEEEAPYPLPIFSQPLSARPVGPTLVTSPTRRAAVDADVKASTGSERLLGGSLNFFTTAFGCDFAFALQAALALAFAFAFGCDFMHWAFALALAAAFGCDFALDFALAFALGCALLLNPSLVPFHASSMWSACSAALIGSLLLGSCCCCSGCFAPVASAGPSPFHASSMWSACSAALIGSLLLGSCCCCSGCFAPVASAGPSFWAGTGSCKAC